MSQPGTNPSESCEEIEITLEQAQKVLGAHDKPSIVISLEEIKNVGFSYASWTKSYKIQTSSSALVLIVSSPNPPSDPALANSVPALLYLHTLTTSSTAIPLPAVRASSTSLSIIPYHYILLIPPIPPPGRTAISLTDARSAGILSPRADAAIELQLGVYLHQLHALQNDYFGAIHPQSSAIAAASPFDDLPSGAAYSWQEAFTPFLEHLLDTLSARFPDLLSYLTLRAALSRAIGFFLFDDADVPSLIWLTGATDDVLLSIPSESTDPDASAASPVDEAEILALAPTLALPHALWGDPLLEALFLPPGPSPAFLEGYSNGPLIVFPRQRTKRLWYTVFLALVVLEERHASEGNDTKVDWAKVVLKECAEKLKDAPCY